MELIRCLKYFIEGVTSPFLNASNGLFVILMFNVFKGFVTAPFIYSIGVWDIFLRRISVFRWFLRTLLAGALVGASSAVRR
jgi:hypothetical protein